MQDLASIKNIPALNRYYRKIHFGFAAGRLNLSPDQIQECTDRKNFTAAELPCEYLSSLPESAKKQLKTRFPEIHCSNLFASGLTASILETGNHIQQEFVHTCSRIFRNLAADGIKHCALDFFLLQILKDEAETKKLSALMHKLHPVLHETDMTVLLPVHLPLPEPFLREKVTAFLREVMIPHLKLRIEIYPHELKQDFSTEETAGTFRLETRSVLFCCNADSGNRILSAHLTPWLRYFSLTGYPGPYLFCPFSQNNRLASIESEFFSKLAGQYSKMPETSASK